MASAVAAAGAALLAVGVLAAGRSRAETPPPPAGRSDAMGVIDTSPAPRRPASEVVPCDVPVVRRDTLRDEQGRTFYLAPDAMHARDGVLMIAGQHSVHATADATGRVVDAVQDSVLVALRGADGRARTFARPAAVGRTLLATVRAAPLPRGRWVLLLIDNSKFVDEPVARRVWLAVLGRAGWESVTSITPPSGVRVLDGASNPLVTDGERLIAALPAIRHDDDFGALLLEGTPAHLTTRFVPLPGATYVAATFADSVPEPALFAVHPNLHAQRSGNALFLYLPDRPAASPRLLTDGQSTSVHHPHAYRMLGGYRVIATEDSRVDRSAPAQASEVWVPHTADAFVQSFATGVAALASARIGSDTLAVAHTAIVADNEVEVSVFFRPGPGRGMRVPVSTPHHEVVGLAQDGTSDVVVATIHGNVYQAASPSLALTWITPRCQATSGRGDAR